MAYQFRSFFEESLTIGTAVMTHPINRKRAIAAALATLEHAGEIDTASFERAISMYERELSSFDDIYFPPYAEGQDCDFNAERLETGNIQIALTHPDPEHDECTRFLSPEEQRKLGKWLLGET